MHVCYQSGSRFSMYRHVYYIPRSLSLLYILVPPTLYPDSDVDINAARGSTVSFHFQVSGQPEPTVVWERGSQRMITDGRIIITTSDGVTSLTLHDVARDDEGLYVCCAMNHLGNTIQECQITLLGNYALVNVIVYIMMHLKSALMPFTPYTCMI